MVNNFFHPPSCQRLIDGTVDDRAPSSTSANSHQYQHSLSRTSNSAAATSRRSTELIAGHEPPLTEEDAILLKRERRKHAQLRYRKKVRDKGKTLERKVKLLREEVERLKQQHQSISRTVPMRTTRFCVLAEYFRLFRKGLELSSPSLNDFDVHRRFLHTTMTSDVVVDTGNGIDAIMWGWEAISRCYPGFKLELVRLENDAGNALVGTTKVTVTIDEKLLCSLFPALVKGTAQSHLRSTLIGQQIVMRGSANFVWNFKKDRIVSALYSVDMLTPMLKLLGNLADVSRVFIDAPFTPECRLAV